MIDEDPFVELVKTCAKACHVLKTTSDGKDIESLSDSSRRQIEDLGRCVDPIKPPLLKITSDTRIFRHIEFAVREPANCARDSQGQYPGFMNDWAVSWRTEISERLGVLDVCGSQLTMPTASQVPQENLEQGGALGVGQIHRHVQRPLDAEISALASVTVRCRFVAPVPHSPLTIGST